MVMTSSQISQMAMAQMGMFASNQSYAQQITPPGGYMPGMGPGMMGGYGTGRAPQYAPGGPPQPGWAPPMYGGMPSMAMNMPFAAPQAGFPQAMGVQMAGGIANGAQSMFGGLQAMSGMAGLAAGGMSLLGMGGGLATGLAAAGSLPVTMGLAAGAYGAQQFGAGVQERRMMNNVLQRNFSGRMGIGEGAQGFNNQEMGQISTMVRGMTSNDINTSYDELTRVMDRTAQMGLYKGAGSVEQFSTKFKQLVGTLKQVAQTLGTTLEGATQMVEQSRGMGFFSGQDITQSLGRAQGLAGISGMSMPTMMQIGQQGSQIGRMMGMKGKTGAGAMQNMAANYMLAMQTGALSSEDMYNATGLTGEEGAAALASRSMDVNSRFLKRGAGRVMNAAFWNKEGGVDEGLIRRAMSGQVSFRELQGTARGNIRATGGQGSEFFRDESRIAGMVQEAGGGDLMIGMLAQHVAGKRGLDINDPRVTRFLQRQTGQDLGEIEAKVKMFQNMPSLMLEKGLRTQFKDEQMAEARGMEGKGLEGLRLKTAHWWEQNVDNKIKQAADNWVTKLTASIEHAADTISGVTRTQVDSRARRILEDFSKTGEGLQTREQYRAAISRFSDSGGTVENSSFLRQAGAFTGMGSRFLEQDMASLGLRTNESKREWRGGFKNVTINESLAAREARYNKVVEGLNTSMESMGISQDAISDMSKTATATVIRGLDPTRHPLEYTRFKEMTMGHNARDATALQTNLLKSDPRLAGLYAKANGNWQKEAAITMALTKSLGGTDYDTGMKDVMRGSNRSPAQVMAEINRSTAALLGESVVSTGGTASRLAKLALRSGLGGLGGMAGLATADSMVEGDQSLAQFQNNAEIMKALTDTATATGSARDAGITKLLAMGNELTDPTARKTLQAAAIQLENEGSKVSQNLKKVAENEITMATAKAHERLGKIGAELSQQTKDQSEQLAGIMKGEDKTLKGDYDALVRVWSAENANPQAARFALQSFIQSHGHTKEGQNLAGYLQTQKGGMQYIGYGMGQGGLVASDLSLKGGSASRMLVQKQLGIDNDLMVKMFGADDRRRGNKLFQQLEGGSKAQQDKALQDIRAQLEGHGLSSTIRGAEFDKQLESGRGGYDQGEQGGIMGATGATLATGAALTGRVPTQQRQVSPQEKQVEYLATIASSQKNSEKWLATLAGHPPASAEEIAAATGGSGGGGATTATPVLAAKNTGTAGVGS